MSDLISRSALIKDLRKDREAVYSYVFCHTDCQHEEELALDLEWFIENQPTVEAKEVVHAKWEECAWVEFDGIHCGVYTYPNGGLACSNCHHAFKKELLCPDNFCPNCGARMVKDNE